MSGNAKQRTTLTNLNEPQQMRELNRQMAWIWDQLLGGLSLKSLNSGTRKIIDSKASGEEVDELGNTVSAHSTAIAQTAQAIELTAAEVSALDGRVAENESKISQTPDEIRLAIESTQFGGRNLLRMTKTLETDDSDLTRWKTDTAHSRIEGSDGFYQIDWEVSGLTENSESILRSPVFRLPDGWMDRKAVISFWVKSEDWALLDGGMEAAVFLTNGDRSESCHWAKLDLLGAYGIAGDDLKGKPPINGIWTRVWGVIEPLRKMDSDGPIAITRQPENFYGAVGETAVFSVVAMGNGLTYQWEYLPLGSTGGWINSTMDDSDTPNLTFTARSYHDGYKYRCLITDENGNTLRTDEVTLTIGEAEAPPIIITVQPVGVTTPVGTTVMFSVAAEGDGLTYQWEYLPLGVTSWTNSTADGNAANTLSFTAKSYHDGYQYRCKITDTNGNTLRTDEVTLTIGEAVGSIYDMTHGWVGWHVARNADFSMKAPQLEFGTQPTDWSPAPEDADEELTRVSSELVAQADEIAMRVTEERLTEAVDGIRVGGTNLLTGAKLLPVGSGADNWRVNNTELASVYEDSSGFSRMRLSASELMEDAWAGVYSPVALLPENWKGRQVTLSAYILSSDWAGMEASAVWGVCLSQGDANRQNYGSRAVVKAGEVELSDGVSSDTPLEDGKWVRVSMTWILDEEALPGGDGDFDANTHVFVQFFLRRNGCCEIYAPKLEFGNKATDWSPAPEDAELEMSSLRSELSVQAGKIAAKVEQSEFDALGNEVSSQRTLIEQTAEDVLLQAGRTVGGTNYLRDSAQSISNSVYNIASYYFSDDLKPKAGETMTVRIWGSLGEGKTGFAIYNTNGYNGLGSLTDNGDGTFSAAIKWKLSGGSADYAVTEQSQTHIQVYATPRTVTGVASTITKIKLERGDYATDWSPHPEDPSVGLNTGTSGGVRVKITPEAFDVDVPGEDGDFVLNEAGGRLPVLTGDDITAPNIAPRYTGPETLYVDPNATSEQIAAGNCYRSLADVFAALNCRWVGKTVTINLAAGMTEYGEISLQGVSGGCIVKIIGNSTNPAKLVGRLNLYFNASPVSVSYLNVDTTSIGINVEGCQTAAISKCVVTGSGTGDRSGIRAANGAHADITGCEIYDCSRSLFADRNGVISASGCKGNCIVRALYSTMYLSGTMPCNSTTWSTSAAAGQVIVQNVTVDQGSKPTVEAEPTTTAFSYLYSDSYCAGWDYYDNEDIWQGYIKYTDSGKQAAVYGVIWFDADEIKKAIGTKTVKQASLRLHMHTGVGRSTAVAIQMYGSDVSYDRTAAPAPTKNYGTIIEAATPGEVHEIAIPNAVINDIVSGTIQALVLKSDDTALHKDRKYSKNYARFSGTTTATSETCPRLTVVYQ